MTIRTYTRILVLALAAAVTGCDGANPPAPTAPSAVQAPLPPSMSTPARAQFPPGVFSPYTLSGVVFEMTTTGATPIEGVAVYCETCGEETHSWSITDSSGTYRFTGVSAAPGVRTPVWFGKEQYTDPPGIPLFSNESGYRRVLVAGDTRFDVELVRR